jgi:hypothetical protein
VKRITVKTVTQEFACTGCGQVVSGTTTTRDTIDDQGGAPVSEILERPERPLIAAYAGSLAIGKKEIELPGGYYCTVQCFVDTIARKVLATGE